MKEVAQLCPTLCHPVDCPWDSPGQNTGVGSRSLLQGIFPTQGWNPALPHCGQILYQLSHQGSPRRLEEWVPFPFSSNSLGFSRPEYWSGEPFPSPGDVPNPGMEPRSPTLQADSLPAQPSGKDLTFSKPALPTTGEALGAAGRHAPCTTQHCPLLAPPGAAPSPGTYTGWPVWGGHSARVPTPGAPRGDTDGRWGGQRREGGAGWKASWRKGFGAGSGRLRMVQKAGRHSPQDLKDFRPPEGTTHSKPAQPLTFSSGVGENIFSSWGCLEKSKG